MKQKTRDAKTTKNEAKSDAKIKIFKNDAKN